MSWLKDFTNMVRTTAAKKHAQLKEEQEQQAAQQSAASAAVQADDSAQADRYSSTVDAYNNFADEYNYDTGLAYMRQTNPGAYVQQISNRAASLMNQADEAQRYLNSQGGSDTSLGNLDSIRRQLGNIVEQEERAASAAYTPKVQFRQEVPDDVLKGTHFEQDIPEDVLKGTQFRQDLPEDTFKYHSGADTTEQIPASFDDMMRQQRLEKIARETENYQRIADQAPFLSSVASVGASLGKASNVGRMVGDYLATGKIDETASYYDLGRMQETVRGTVSDKISSGVQQAAGGVLGDEAAASAGDAASWLYNVGMSMADSTVTMLLYGGAAGLITGSGSAMDTVRECKEAGMSDDRAFLLGGVAGIAEGLTEKLGIDALFDTKALNKNALGYVIKNMAAEGTEEGLTALANTAADILADVIAGTQEGQFFRSVSSYEQQGMSRAKAVAKTVVDTAVQAGLDVLGGALSGGAMGGVGVAVNSIDQALSPAQKNVRTVQRYSRVLGRSGATVFNSMYEGFEQDIPADVYLPEMTRYYNAGKSGEEFNGVTRDENSGVIEPMREAAYLAGQSDAAAETAANATGTNSVGEMDGNEITSTNEVQQNGPLQEAIEDTEDSTLWGDGSGIVQTQEPSKTETRAGQQTTAYMQEGMDYEEQTGTAEMGLRGSGERIDGAYTGRQTGAVAEGAGQAQSGRRFKRGGAADVEASSLTYGERVSTASLGIGGGSDTDAVRVVKGGMTAAMKSAKEEAARQGKRMMFVSGNMTVGGQKVRGVITGDRIIVQADHPRFTSKQIARHELGHDMIDSGSVDVDAVKRQLAEKYTPQQMDDIAEMYTAAYKGSGMTADEAWVEMICDSLGEMNIFEGSLDTAAGQYAEVLKDIRTQVETARTEARGPPEQRGDRYSIETLEDGKRYVQADRQVMTGSDPKRWGRQMEVYINEQIRKGEDVIFPTEDGHLLVLTERSAYKLTDQHKAKIEKKSRELLSDEDYALKMRAAAHIDELIEVGRFKDYAPDKFGQHQNDVGEDGFNYFTAFYRDFDGEYYRVIFSSALNDKNETTYSIGEIRKRQKKKPSTGSGSSVQKNGALIGAKASSDTIITQESQNVNREFGEDPKKTPMQKAFEKAGNLSREETDLSELRKENTKLRAQVEYWRNQTKVTDHPTLREGDVRKAAGELLEDYESTADKKQIAKNLKSLGETILAGGKDLSWAAVKDEAAAIARTIVNNSDADSEAMAKFDFDSAVAIEYVTNDILSTVMTKEIREVPATYADRQAEKIVKLKGRNKEKLDVLRETKNARIEEVRKREREKAKEAVRKVREKKEEQIADVTERYKAYRDKTHESRVAKELRGKIERHAKDLSSKLIRPTDKKHIPQKLQGVVLELLDAINLESAGGKETKRTAAFEKLKEVYRELRHELVIDPNLMGNEDVKGLLDEVIAMREIPIATMNSTELNTIWKTMRAVESSIYTANRMFNEQRWESVSAAADSLRRDNTGKKSRNAWRLGKGVQNLLSLEMLTPETYWHMMGETGDAIFRMMGDARDAETRLLKKATDFTNQAIDKMKVNDLERDIHTVTLGGEKVELSTAQLMELYVLSNREQAREHLLVGGILPTEVKGKGLKNISRPTPVRNISPQELKAAVSLLSAEQVKLADKLQRYLSNEVSKWGNEASMQVYNYEKFGEKNYWPIKSNRQEIRKSIDKDTAVTSLANRGFTKSTVPNANNSVVLGSIFDTYANHVVEMASYSAWLATMEDINRIRNYRFKNDAGTVTGTVDELFAIVHGEKGSDYLSRLLADLANGPARVSSGNPFGKLMGNYKAAAVGANLRVIVQQPTAALRAMDVISPQYFVKGIPVTKGWQKAKTYAPIAVWKDWGYFDINTGRQIRNVLFNTDSALDKVRNVSMSMAGYADSMTWGYLWGVCEAETKAKHPNLERGSDEYYETVAKRFTEVIDHTQVVDGVLQRSQIMRNPDNLAKMSTSFMGEPTKQYNMLISALYDASRATSPEARRRGKKRLARTAVSLCISGVVNAAMQSFVDALRDNDREKKYWEKWLVSFFGFTGEEEKWRDYVNAVFSGNLPSAFNPVGYVPYFKDVLSILQGYDVTRMDMDSVEKTITAAQNMIKALGGNGKYTIGGASANLFAETARMIGLPVANLKREIESAVMSVSQWTSNYLLPYRMEKALLNMNYESNTQTFMEHLYQAYVNDKEAYLLIYDDLVKDGYDVDKIKSNMERRMAKAAGLEKASELERGWIEPAEEKEYERLRGIYGKEGAGDDYAYVKASEPFEDESGMYYDALYDAMDGDFDSYKKIYDDLYRTVYEAELKKIKEKGEVEEEDWEETAEAEAIDRITSAMESRMKKAEGVNKVDQLSERYMNPYEKEGYDKTISKLSGGKDNALVQEYAKGKNRDDKKVQYDALVTAYDKDNSAYRTIYNDMISSGLTEKEIRGAVEGRWKKEQGVEKVEELAARWLSPDEETVYNGILDEVKRSPIWDNATEEQRDKTLSRLYTLAVETDSEGADGTQMQAKIDAGKQYGLTEGEYMLFLMARQMTDKPTDSGKLGSYTNEEIREAIAMLGLSRSESSYLWEAAGKSEKSNPWR